MYLIASLRVRLLSDGLRRYASQQWLGNVARDCFASCIAQANQFMPVRRFSSRRRLSIVWINRRREGDRDARGTRKVSSVAQKLSRSRQRHRNHRHASGHSSFEGPQLKRANAVFRGKCAFGKNKDGLARAKNLLDLLRLTQPRPGIRAIEREMPHLPEKRADEWHTVDFSLCNKMVRHAETTHERQHVKIARVIRRIDLGTRNIHVLLADYAHWATCQSQQIL